MAKRSKPIVDGAEKVIVEKVDVESFPEEVILIPVVSVYPSIIKYSGRETGQPYVWNGAGDIQNVNEKDVPYLLEKRIGNRGCCGSANTNGNKVFELLK